MGPTEIATLFTIFAWLAAALVAVLAILGLLALLGPHLDNWEDRRNHPELPELFATAGRRVEALEKAKQRAAVEEHCVSTHRQREPWDIDAFQVEGKRIIVPTRRNGQLRLSATATEVQDFVEAVDRAERNWVAAVQRAESQRLEVADSTWPTYEPATRRAHSAA